MLKSPGGYCHIKVTGPSSVPLRPVKNMVLVPLRVFSFKKAAVVAFRVPLRVEIR